MKKLLPLICLCFFTVFAHAQTKQKQTVASDLSAKKMIVEASCGECNLGMKGTGCTLAVKIDGIAYLVEGGPTLNNYGDAHGKDGMCNKVRRAEVTGAINGDKFTATSFKLLPVSKKKG